MNGFCSLIRIVYETIKNQKIKKEEKVMIQVKKLAAVLAVAAVVSVCGTTALAAGPACGRNYVDANGDGVCDNWGNGGCRWNYVDADGDGICDNRGNGGCGWNYVDADGDGICDNARYGIKYNLNGGRNNAKNPSCYFQSSKTIRLGNPTRKGYTFKGWYADKQYSKKVTAIKAGSTGEKVFYAKWKKN